MNAVRRIVRGLRVASASAQRELGVTAAQLFVLGQLREEPARSIADLAARTATDASSVSVVVSRLVDDGFIARKTSKEDARRAELHLTAKGRRLLDRAKESGSGDVAQLRMIAALKQLPPLKLRHVVDGLEALAAALGESTGPAPMFFEEERASKAKEARRVEGR